MAESGGWSAGASLELQESLGLSGDAKQKGTVAAWKDDKFLTPFLENDPLLYSFDDEGEDDDVEELNAAEKTTALRELLEGSSTDLKALAETSVSTGSAGASDLADITKVFLSLDEGIREELASPVDVPDVAADSSSGSSLQDDGTPDGEGNQKGSVKSCNGTEPRVSKKRDKKDLKVTFAEVAKREARNVNKDYFGSYSTFGIHREMLSDKVFDCKL